MRSPLRNLVVALAALTLAACHEVPPPEPPPAAPPAPAPSAAEPPSAPEVASAASASAPDAAPPAVAPSAAPAAPAPPPSRMSLEQIRGSTPEDASRIFAPVQDRVEQCAPAGTGGAIKIRVASTKSSTKLDVDPSTTIEHAMRTCVLEALSTVDVDAIFDRGGPTPRPSSFSSLVTVAWP